MAPSDEKPGTRIKSALELALERLDSTGVGRPRDEPFDPGTLAAMAEARQKATAKLAEIEILERRKLAAAADPAERQKMEQEYRSERLRIEERCEREIAALRDAAS